MQRIAIPLSSLKEGESKFSFHAVLPDLKVGEGCSFPGEIAVQVTATSMSGDYFFDVHAVGQGCCVCDRCGEEFQEQTEGTIRTLFTFDRSEAEEGDENIRFLSPSTQEIDVTQDVLDALLLAVPQKQLCREDCRGLCPRCGTNLNSTSCSCEQENIDPRWEALKGLSRDG